ncbi:winged helix DNA-binding domain-containing protein [Actinomadura sp. HBU206391]|uniref:winged helix DNA-binding domain-containing protein n=1 Tax=Actinomadura sp. HBU206391 TaxID=2731692 RepID=UPI0016502A52|nr:winged helix DNA-binding domain-containing protein [Actinomadura sp. HBU206391]MBC6460762.1 winged helix DNA-binding domain-containing protein [Actinomadura sp. HBU206391]
METRLTRRALGRATLARQLLMSRSKLPVLEAVEHLVGLQAQTPHTWYLGLAARLDGIRPEDVADLLARRQLVRIALMRSTIHLVTARDCLYLRPLVQPVIERGMRGNFGKDLLGLDREKLTAAGRALVEERPMTPTRLGRLLAEQEGAGWAGRSPESLAHAVRAWVPLVQVPPRGVWGSSGAIAHTSAEAWLGRPLAREPSIDELVLRYLGAFGPATVKDVQTWSGLTRLREVVDRLRPRLAEFVDEEGRELFDLPDAPRPDADVPAPPRLLYDFDNLLLSHADRGRFITEAYHEQRYGRHGPMPNIVLLDGFTGGDWKVTRDGGTAVLTIRPYGRLSPGDIDALTGEAARMLAFAAADADAHDVRVVPGPWPHA